VFVLSDLARENVAKGGKGVMKSLVVDGGIQVLNKDVALASLAKGRVTLRPHDAAGSALDQGVVELLEGALTVVGAVVVDVGVSERATGDGVTADTDGCDLANRREELEEHGLGDGRVKLTDVEGSRVLVRLGRSGRSACRVVAGRCVDATVDVGGRRGWLRSSSGGRSRGLSLNVGHDDDLMIFWKTDWSAGS